MPFSPEAVVAEIEAEEYRSGTPEHSERACPKDHMEQEKKPSGTGDLWKSPGILRVKLLMSLDIVGRDPEWELTGGCAMRPTSGNLSMECTWKIGRDCGCGS